MSFCVVEAVRACVLIGVSLSFLFAAGCIDMLEHLFGEHAPRPHDDEDWL